MSVISPVQSHYHEGSPVGRRSLLRWEGFVEKVSFEPGVKEWRSDGCWEWGIMRRMGWKVNEEVNRDKTGYGSFAFINYYFRNKITWMFSCIFFIMTKIITRLSVQIITRLRCHQGHSSVTFACNPSSPCSVTFSDILPRDAPHVFLMIIPPPLLHGVEHFPFPSTTTIRQST